MPAMTVTTTTRVIITVIIRTIPGNSRCSRMCVLSEVPVRQSADTTTDEDRYRSGDTSQHDVRSFATRPVPEPEVRAMLRRGLPLDTGKQNPGRGAQARAAYRPICDAR